MANFTQDIPDNKTSVRGVVHSPKNVECIARFDGTVKDKDGTVKGYAVSFQTNEAIYSSSELRAGKGQENAFLVNRRGSSYTDTSVTLSKSQFDALNAAIGDNKFVSDKSCPGRSGVTYGAFKADITVPVKSPCYDADGNCRRDENGRPILRNVGMMPNPKTFAPSDVYTDDHTFDSSDFTRHVKNVKYTNSLRDDARKDAKEAKNSTPKKFTVGLDSGYPQNQNQKEDSISK